MTNDYRSELRNIHEIEVYWFYYINTLLRAEAGKGFHQ